MVLSALDKNPWNVLGLDSILLHIESIAFERGRGTYLPRYAALSQRDAKFQQHFVRYLLARESTLPLTPEDDDYQTYLGSRWSIPIHLGILVASASGEERTKFFERLRQWQEHTWYMTQIGPHFGLSRDYDEFILGLAPPLWALIAILMRELPEAIGYIATQCKNILEKLKDASPEISFFTAAWMLYVASVNDAGIECYEFARKFINERGGIPVRSLRRPIGQLSLEESNDWISAGGEPYEQVPTIQDFRKLLGISMTEVEDIKMESISLALEALINDNMIFEWGPRLVRLFQGR